MTTTIYEVTNHLGFVATTFTNEDAAKELIKRNIDCGGWDWDWHVVPKTIFDTVEEHQVFCCIKAVKDAQEASKA
jgi:hypothetical protein